MHTHEGKLFYESLFENKKVMPCFLLPNCIVGGKDFVKSALVEGQHLFVSVDREGYLFFGIDGALSASKVV